MSRASDRMDFFVAVAGGEVAQVSEGWVLRGSRAVRPVDGHSRVAQFAREGIEDGVYELVGAHLRLTRESANLGLDGVRERWRERYPEEGHPGPSPAPQGTLDG